MGNRGFSLIELIIVIAVMAILIGIVGTQVVPYLNRAREAKDMQIINSYCTAAVTAYAYNAKHFADMEGGGDYYGIVQVEVFGDVGRRNYSGPRDYLIKDVYDITGYSSAGDLQKAMSSVAGRTIENVRILIDFKQGAITAWAIDGLGNAVLEPVTAYIGNIPASDDDDGD